jgi:glycosyltransferase involved in cell wall biosynthesis
MQRCRIFTMRVLVDCTQITRNKAGVGVYALNLIRGLRKLRTDDFKLWILVQSDDPDFAFEEDGTHVIRVQSRFFRSLPLRFLMEQFYVPWLLRKHKIDVVHSLHYSFPLLKTRARKVVTICDMTFFIMPEVHEPVKIAYFRSFMRASSHLADSLIFISQSTKKDWKHYFPKSSQPGFVVTLGKSLAFRPDIVPREVDQVIQKYGLTRPYILYIGTIEPRKNLPRLIRAFAQIANQFTSVTLVICGKKGWGYAEVFEAAKSLNIESRVIFTGFVEEDDKPHLLAGAEVFAYPSLYEGFGIPVLEALACGAPTLTSAISSIPEVAGDAAVLVNPENTTELAEQLARLLADPELRNSLRALALKQAARFTWERTASETLSVYRDLVSFETSKSS